MSEHLSDPPRREGNGPNAPSSASAFSASANEQQKHRIVLPTGGATRPGPPELWAASLLTLGCCFEQCHDCHPQSRVEPGTQGSLLDKR